MHPANRKTLFSLFFLGMAAILAATVVGLRKVMVTAWTDEGCVAIGGKVVGHEDIFIESPSGDLEKVTVTKCEIATKPKKPKAVGTATAFVDEMPNLSTFSAILETSGLAATVDSVKDMTLLSPTDAAIARLPKRLVDQLQTDRVAASTFVKRHLVVGSRVSVAAKQGLRARLARSIQGQDRVSRSIDLKDGKLSVGSANVLAVDIETGNGTLLILDNVLAERQ